MTYQVTTPATTSLVTLDDLKTHLLLFGDDSYDPELQSILLSAEGFVSDFLGEFLVSTTVRVNLLNIEDTKLPHKSISNISVHYWDANNAAQVWSPTNYVLDTSDVYPEILFTTKPANLSATFNNAGYVTYDTSMDPVPAKVKHAVLLVAAELFENRQDSSDKDVSKVHLTSMRLLQSLRGW